MRSSLDPLRLWNYCAELHARIRSSTTHNNVRLLNGQVPQILVDGNTFDISILADFGWYNWIKHENSLVVFPLDYYQLGRWFGPAPNIGNEMAMYILKNNGHVVIRTALRHLTDEENNSEVETNNKTHFDSFIQSK